MLRSTTMKYVKQEKQNTGGPNWAELETELLELIISKLSFVNMFRFQGVCSWWLNAGESYKSSAHKQQCPLLMLPPKEESDCDDIYFYSLEDERVYNFNNTSTDLIQSRCVGSSHGWLVLLDKHADPCLLNLFSQAKIQLPTKETFPHIHSISGKNRGSRKRPHYGDDDQDELMVVAYNHGLSISPIFRIMSFEDKQVLIKKGILSSSQSCDDNYTVFTIYSDLSKLAFYRNGAHVWTDIHGQNAPYNDIICYKNQLYALGDVGSVEVWDYNCFNSDLPVKTMNILPAFPKQIQQFERELYSSNCYLVESSGDILLVIRYIGEFVCDGKPHYEGEVDSNEGNQPFVCPYQTLDFKVFKLDLDREKWLATQNLGERVLFLGGNHSLSLSTREHPECKRNSIYFMDDSWDRMDEDYCYGGHDMGMFSFEDKRVEIFYDLVDSDVWKVEPPPFWVVPNP